MGAIFTREERAVVLFLTATVLLGSAVMIAKRVNPSLAPDLSTGTEVGSAQPEAEPAPSWPIDVNRAGPEELERLPGVGPVKAAEIARVREERGAFRSLEDLLDVKGIGPKTLEGLRGWAAVTDTSADSDSGRPRSPAAERGGHRAERGG
jgi:competence protein ComEA